MPPCDNRNHPMIPERNDMMLKNHVMKRDLCITSPFDQFLRQSQNLILKISNIFLWLIPIESGSLSLNLNKIEHSAEVSKPGSGRNIVWRW